MMINPDDTFNEFKQGIKDNCDNKRLKEFGWPYIMRLAHVPSILTGFAVHGVIIVENIQSLNQSR
jgi:hypothetical protein